MSTTGKIDNKYKYHVTMMKDAGIKCVGDFLDSLVVAKIIVPSRVEVDFKISKKTITKLRKTDPEVSISTLRKMPLVIAHYLMIYKKDLEADDTVSDYKEKIEGINRHIAQYRSIFGFVADVCIDKINKGEDLRELLLK